MALKRPAETSHARGLAGTPSRGHCSRAARKASCSASSATSATVVDGRGETPVLSDGPYQESKEYLGGFWVIEAPDLDAALEWAKQGSKACGGKVEVRPFEAA